MIQELEICQEILHSRGPPRAYFVTVGVMHVCHDQKEAWDKRLQNPTTHENTLLRLLACFLLSVYVASVFLEPALTR